MLSLQRLVPHIMDQVNLETPGWSLKARLITVVAWRTLEPHSWTELGTVQLGELLATLDVEAPTAWDVRWAREVLQRLATDHRILEWVPRGGGRRDLYRVRGDELGQVREWRHVPWIRSARAAQVALSGLAAGVRSGASAVPAGQTLFSGAVDTRYGHLGDLDLSTKPPHQPPKEPHQPPNRHAQNRPGTAPAPESSEPASQCFLDSVGVRQSVEADGRTDGPDQQPNGDQAEQLARRLAAAINRLVPDPIYGAEPRRRLRAVAETHLEHADELLAYLAGLTGIRKWGGALDALEMWAPAGAGRPIRDLERELTNTRRLLATMIELDPDSDRVLELSVKVTQLEDLLGADRVRK